jgi:Tfp pilus assembly PilM family ATPase
MPDIPVWGVDLTAVSLKAVKLALSSEGKVSAEAWEVIDFAEDVENVQGLGRHDAQKRALHSFLRHHDVRNCLVFASQRGESAFNRTVTVPQTGDPNLDRLLEYEAQQQIPYPLEDVFWDRRVVAIRPNGDVIATIYAIQKEIVNERLSRLELAGLPVDGLVLRPVALQNFCSRERLLEPGGVVIDVGYGATQVLLVHEDQTTFRCLAVGGSELVKRLGAELKVDHLAALRLATGRTKPKDSQVAALARLRKEVASEIGSEVLQAIRAYTSSRPGFQPTNVVLFETHPATPPMAEVLKAEMKMPVFRPKGFKSIEIEPGIVSAGIQENFAGLARACGLALQGLGKADVALTLYPKDRTRSFRPKPIGWLVASVLVLGMVLTGWLQRRSLAEDFAKEQETATQLEQQLSGRSVAALEKTAADDLLAPVKKKWASRTAQRAGRLGWYDALVAAIKEKQGGAGRDAPLLVHFEWGEVAGRVPSANLGQVVLAAPENRPTAEIDAALKAFLEKLVGKEGLAKVSPGPAWSSGSLSATAPGEPDTRALRHRFRHATFELHWEAP